MASTNTNKLNITELDFDQIKNSLKRYLNNQEEFSDYDFESSGLSILLDILSYNTHYNAFYLNMLANELFIDTATIRDSVVSLAKGLGYTPRSVTGAKATVNITFTPNDLGGVDDGVQSDQARLGSLVTLPKGSVFTSELENRTYSFVTRNSYVAAPVANTTGGYLQTDGVSVVPYVAQNVEIVEGIYVNTQFIYNDQINQRFILPNPNIDTETLTVVVTDIAGGTSSEIYTKADNYADLLSDSTVYFLQEATDRRFEIYFGDNNVGKKPTDGSIIDVSYVISNEDAGNGATIFNSDPIKSPYYGINGSTKTYNPTTTTVQRAAGGGARESIDSIKFLAPLNYQAQNRMVTTSDYEVRLQSEYPQLDAVHAWGGEDNVPPEYGKVFVSIKPKEGFVLSLTEKQRIITNILEPKNVIGIQPVIVDPDFMFLDLDVSVKWDSRRTSLTELTLKSGIVNEIISWGQENLEKFEEYFRYSALLRVIDAYNEGIINNLTNVRVRKEVKPKVGSADTYIINFSNSINHPHTSHKGSVTSSTFTYAGTTSASLTDNNGILEIRGQLSSGENVLVSSNAGTVNYTTGQIVLNNFNPSSVNNGGILSIYITPLANDVVPFRNQLITIIESDLRVKMFDDASRQSSTISRSGSNGF